jgi:pyruvate kinase
VCKREQREFEREQREVEREQREFERTKHSVNPRLIDALSLGCAAVVRSAQMITAGMDLCRLNFSHGTHEGHRAIFKLVRKISAEHEHQVSILADIQGPKIRCGKMQAPFQPVIGSTVKVTAEEVIGTMERFTITYATIVKDLKKGDLIFINDGVVRLRVQSKTESVGFPKGG